MKPYFLFWFSFKTGEYNYEYFEDNKTKQEIVELVEYSNLIAALHKMHFRYYFIS